MVDSMILALKAAAGALIVLLISYISKTNMYVVSSLIPLFPTFALIANISVAHEKGVESLQKALIFGMWSLIPYFVYLVSMYFLVSHINLVQAIIVSIAFWCLAAYVLVRFA